MIQRMVETGRKYIPKEKIEFALYGAGGLSAVLGTVILVSSGNFGAAFGLFTASGSAVAVAASRTQERVKNEEKENGEKLAADNKTLDALVNLIEPAGVLPEEQRQQFETDVKTSRDLINEFELATSDIDPNIEEIEQRMKENHQKVIGTLKSLGMDIGDRNPFFLFPSHLNFPEYPPISHRVEEIRETFKSKGLGMLMEKW